MHIYYHLCNTWLCLTKYIHLIDTLFLNWGQTLRPRLVAILGRKETNVETVRIFRFLCTSQTSYHMCDWIAEKYIFPKNVQTFQATPAPKVTEDSHNTVKTFIMAGIGHLWKREDPTWATLPLRNKECFRAGKKY